MIQNSSGGMHKSELCIQELFEGIKNFDNAFSMLSTSLDIIPF